MKRALFLLVLIIGAATAYYLFTNRTVSPSDAELHRAFTSSMSGVTLVGNSTRLSREGVFGPERYVIDSVSHVSGDTWLLRTRMNVKGTEVPVPIPLAIKWAGDTPVITMTNLSIPGVGTYTARVLLYGNQYAGTWSGGNSGGQLFGKIVRNEQP